MGCVVRSRDGMCGEVKRWDVWRGHEMGCVVRYIDGMCGEVTRWDVW